MKNNDITDASIDDALEVRIVELEAMKVAVVHADGEAPEKEAWEKLRAYANPNDLFADVEAHPVFGFNNPGPRPNRKEYGYELWIRVDPEAEPEKDVELKDFPGGLYAVASCKLFGDPKGSIVEIWQKLSAWVHDHESNYTWRETHELEKVLNPLAPEEDFVLELYLPVAE